MRIRPILLLTVLALAGCPSPPGPTGPTTGPGPTTPTTGTTTPPPAPGGATTTAACDAASLAARVGTEAGMITPIVRKVEAQLRANAARGGAEVVVDIVFPVASEAIATTDDPLAVIPGVASGEGCTVAGGCATCPYMKMNSLRALLTLAERLDTVPDEDLAPFHPRVYLERVRGRSVAELGGVPILHMRAFGAQKRLSDELVADIQTRVSA